MATKKLVPRANNEGGLGTAAKTWGDSWLTNLTLTQLATSTSVSGIVEDGGLLEKRNLTTIGIDVQDTEDSTCYVGLWEDATGVLLPKTDESLLYNASSEILNLIGTLKMGSSANANEHVIHRESVSGLPNGGVLSIKAGDTIGGTNQAGGYLNLYSGLGTGTGGGVASGISLWCAPPIASGTTTQNYAKNVLFYSLATHMAQRTYSPASATHYYELKVGSHAATTILTVDSGGGSQAHLDYDIDGNIDLKAEGDIVYDAVGADHTWKTNGTQQMHLNNTGLTIDNIPTEAAPVNILVDNVATPGLVSQMALSSLPTTLISVLDTEDTTCYVGLWESATGNLAPKTDEGLTYNALTGSEMLNIHGGITMGLGTAANNQFLSRVSNPGVGGNRLEIKAGTSGAGTNLGGGQMNIHTGLGTGNASNPSIQFIGASSQTSGTTAQLSQGVCGIKHVGDGGSTSYNQYAMYGPVVGGNPAGQFEINCYPGGATTILTQDQDYTGSVHTADLLLDIEGDIVIDTAVDNIEFKYNGTTTATVKSLRTESFIIACSDETTDLTTGLKATFRMPYAFTLTDIRASLTTAAGGNDFVADVKQGGVSIFITNLLTIDEGDKTSVGSGSPHTFSSTSLLNDQEITFHVNTIGSSTAGAGLKVTLIGHITV